MKIGPKRSSATTATVLISLSLLAFSFAIIGGSPGVAAATSSNCADPSVPTGTPPTLNSTFTLTVIGAAGQKITYDQNTILSVAACTSSGGFVHGSPPFADNYGNYTGIPLLTLVNLVGGISPGQTVTATSGTDNYQTIYTYAEVVNGTGWGSIYTTSSLNNSVTSSPPLPMYVVLAYLWNGSPLSAYACTSGSPPCPNGPETAGTGPLRTVTLNSNPGYLIAKGAPWNKAVTTIQVNNSAVSTPSTGSTVPTPEFGPGTGSQLAIEAGVVLVVVLGFLALVVRRSFPSRLEPQSN